MSNTPQPTVLAELIKDMEEHRRSYANLPKSSQVDYAIVNTAINLLDTYIKNIIPLLLPREREQIEKSFEDGFHQDFYTEDETASDYFTQNYVQE